MTRKDAANISTDLISLHLNKEGAIVCN